MMRKLIIAGAILVSLFFVSTLSVTATEYTDDVKDTCKDMEGEDCGYDRPNVDIYKISYTKNGLEVQVTLQLYAGGEIKDSTLVVLYSYMLILETDLNQYNIEYMDKAYAVYDMDENEIDVKTSSGAGTNKLSVTFDLSADDEEILSLTAFTAEMSTSSGDSYIDMYPNLEVVVVDAGGPYTGYENESIQFSGDIAGSDIGYSWYWDFGDGDISEEKSPTHKYTQPGTYTVALEVINSDGSSGGSATATVTVKAKSSPSSTSNKDDNGSGLLPFIVLVGVIVVAGIAVVVYVMRR